MTLRTVFKFPRSTEELHLMKLQPRQNTVFKHHIARQRCLETGTESRVPFESSLETYMSPTTRKQMESYGWCIIIFKNLVYKVVCTHLAASSILIPSLLFPSLIKAFLWDRVSFYLLLIFKWWVSVLGVGWVGWVGEANTRKITAKAQADKQSCQFQMSHII